MKLWLLLVVRVLICTTLGHLTHAHLMSHVAYKYIMAGLVNPLTMLYTVP